MMLSLGSRAGSYQVHMDLERWQTGPSMSDPCYRTGKVDHKRCHPRLDRSDGKAVSAITGRDKQIQND